MKRISILGSSGSIGENALRVVAALPGCAFDVCGLAVYRNWPRVLEQAEQFGVEAVAVVDEDAARACRAAAPSGLRVLSGEGGLCDVAALSQDLVLCCVVGMAGLKPVMAAVEEGTDVALATKEVLVAAGRLVCSACEQNGARLFPVDSEHSALFQSLQHRHRLPWCLRCGDSDAGPVEDEIRRLVLTASGGPFAERPDVDFDRVTVKDALNHPNWSMGSKVTIDSATMMNKGLEIMEARWLFNIPVDRIDVLIHRESIVHSLVEFTDRSLIGQFSVPDMRFAIQYAMTWPDRPDNPLPELDLAALGALHFSRPQPDRFPALRLAKQAAAIGGTMPAVLNAANEVAVERFLNKEIGFSGIWRVVEAVMAAHARQDADTLDTLFEIDSWARTVARDQRERM